MSPFNQGYRAREVGVPKSLNPYHHDEDAAKHWDDGWDQKFGEQLKAHPMKRA